MDVSDLSACLLFASAELVANGRHDAAGRVTLSDSES